VGEGCWRGLTLPGDGQHRGTRIHSADIFDPAPVSVSPGASLRERSIKKCKGRGADEIRVASLRFRGNEQAYHGLHQRNVITLVASPGDSAFPSASIPAVSLLHRPSYRSLKSDRHRQTAVDFPPPLERTRYFVLRLGLPVHSSRDNPQYVTERLSFPTNLR